MQLLRPANIGPLGTLLLILIFVMIHAIAVVFDQYRILPLFYLIVFMVALVNIIQALRGKLKIRIHVRD